VPPESLDDLDDDFGWLLEAAEQMNEYKPPETVRVPREHGGGSLPGNRPGDDFNRRAGWDDVLPRHGWKAVGRSGEKVYWRRPGKDHGWSATTGYCRTDLRGDLLYVFTTSAPPLESEQAYSKFEAYTYLEHGGDWSAAFSALQDQGYGPTAGAVLIPGSSPVAGVSNSQFPIPSPIGKEQGTGGGPHPRRAPGAGGWLAPIPASQLRKLEANRKWLWQGYLSRAGVTLMSALWKAGKTTLLAHLLRALEADGTFCGRPVKGCRVLVVSEEDETTWAERRDALGLKDHLEFLPRPFRARPTMAGWNGFLAHLAALCAERHFDLVIFDTVSKLWPVRDENDATQVENALVPIYALTDAGVAVLLVHHFRKGDGTEATGSRGSGAIPAFVDTIMEFRRFEAAVRDDARRVLSSYGRFRETEEHPEVVLRWDKERNVYESLDASKAEVKTGSLQDAIAAVLPHTQPGLTQDQVVEMVTGKTADIKAALNAGAESGRWSRTGKGERGSPYLYWQPPPLSVSRPHAQGEDGDGNGKGGGGAAAAEEAELLIYLRLNGPATAAALAKLTGRGEAETERSLDKLTSEGHLQAEGRNGSTFYVRPDSGEGGQT
jgi:hypothetical protein